MRKIIAITMLCFIAISAHADVFSEVNSIEGKWTNKSSPGQQIFEFTKGSDFIYTYNWKKDGKALSSVRKGVWETGIWKITFTGRADKRCNLTIYLDANECCIEFKFIADNLIMTNRYGYNYDVCQSRVLIRKK